MKHSTSAIALPGHQCHALDLLSYRTASNYAAKLDHAVTPMSVDSLLSAVAKLNGHAGTVQNNIALTGAEVAPFSYGSLALLAGDHQQTHQVRGPRQVDESVRESQRAPPRALVAHLPVRHRGRGARAKHLPEP